MKKRQRSALRRHGIAISLLGLLSLNGPICCRSAPLINEQVRSWGTDSFDSKRWKVADNLTRSSMLYDFLTRYNVIGMRSSEIYDLLGPSTSYYLHDNIPAYLLGSPSVISNYGPGYLVAFLLNQESGLVTSIHIEPPVE